MTQQHQTQASLTEFADDAAAAETDAETSAPGQDQQQVPDDEHEQTATAPPTDGDLVCPWCTAPESEWRDARGSFDRPACGECDAVIPVDCDWVHENRPIPVYR